MTKEDRILTAFLITTTIGGKHNVRRKSIEKLH